MKTGSKIKFVRELNGYTQEYVANRLGLSQSAYYKIEAGITDITLSRLQKICTIFHIDLVDLIQLSTTQMRNGQKVISSLKATRHAVPKSPSLHYNLLVEYLHFIMNKSLRSLVN